MPTAIWPPGSPVRFSYWSEADGHTRTPRRELGVVVDGSYRANGYVIVQSLVDFVEHRFDFDETGDYAKDSFPMGEEYGEPVAVETAEVRSHIGEYENGSVKAKELPRPKLIAYLKTIGIQMRA